MDEKKEISEMIQEFLKDRDVCRLSDCETCEGREYGEQCLLSFFAKTAIRKAYEVRKETAREFKQTMKDIFRFVLRNKGNTSIPYFNAEELVFAKFDKEVDREFLQEYGIEVDE